MTDLTFGDILFILVVFGIIYACLLLARRAGKSRPKERSKPDEG